MSNSLWPCGLQHARLPCPSLSPGVCLNSYRLSGWCYLAISSSATPKVQDNKQNSNKPLLCPSWQGKSHEQASNWVVTGLQGCVCVCMCMCRCVCVWAQSLTLCELYWTQQTPPSMGFSRQEYWSRLSFPTPGDIPDPGMENASPMSPALAGGYFTTILESPGLGLDGGDVSCLQEILRKGSEFFRMVSSTSLSCFTYLLPCHLQSLLTLFHKC